jgi:hypothetical protein
VPSPKPYPRPVPWPTSLLILATALAAGFVFGNFGHVLAGRGRCDGSSGPGSRRVRLRESGKDA